MGDSGGAAWKAEDFHLGADVYSSDGKEVGKLVHVLVDADYKLRALVVRESSAFMGRRLAPASLLLADEVIVPREALKDVTHERVDVSLSASDVRRLPAYLSYREKGESAGDELEDVASVIAQSPELPRWLEEVANKPPDELEIDGGEPVMLGRTGKKLGEVKDVLFDADELVGVVLKPEGLFRREVILPRRFLDRSDDAALFAKLDERDLQHLTPFEPKD